MNRSRSAAALVFLSAVSVIAACNPRATPAVEDVPSGLEGAWVTAEVATGGASPSTAVNPAGVFIFTKTHYSMMRVIGTTPRPLFKAIDPTSAEKISAYDTFVANTGTYELSGTTLTTRPIVAKNPNFMGGGHDTYDYHRMGDTLHLTGKSTNIRLLIGGTLVGDTTAATETTIKLVKVQ